MKKSQLLVYIILFSAILEPTFGQSINRNWKQDLGEEMEQFKDCALLNESDNQACNQFVTSALSTVYKVNDFYSKKDQRPMQISEISEYLKSSKQWKLIGHGYEQDALRTAQQLANSNKAVVAVYLDENGIGQLSIIVPGQLTPSGSWGFEVPNSAALFPSNPEQSYVDKGLSYSFRRTLIKEVMLYARNY